MMVGGGGVGFGVCGRFPRKVVPVVFERGGAGERRVEGDDAD